MRSPTSRRVPGATALALGLSLLVATQALAVTWASPRAMTPTTPSRAGPSAIVATGATSAIVALTQETATSTRILTRRTTDSGAGWLPAVDMSSAMEGDATASQAALASWGAYVDLVYLYGGSDFGCSEGGCQLAYRRSVDRGVSWSPIRILSAPLTAPDGAIAPRIARRGENVLLTWTVLGTGAIRVRSSIDGGATFRPAVTAATTTNMPYQSSARNGWANVAIGSSMSYLTYASVDGTVVVRRSGDGGALWEPATPLASNANTVDALAIAAAGSMVLVGWTAFAFKPDDSWSVYRRSTNSGASWVAAKDIWPRSGTRSWSLTLDYRGGSWLATFERCVTTDCSATAPRAVYHVQGNTDATMWGPVGRVSQTGLAEAFPAGATMATKLLVAYTGHLFGEDPRVWVRAGVP